MTDRIVPEPSGDGIDRRGFLECMAWVGTGLAWSVCGGVLSSHTLGAQPEGAGNAEFTFAQVSDSHIGFAKEPNKNVTATFEQAIARINALPRRPDFLIHTGDLTHLAKPDEFDTCAQVLKTAKTGEVFYVPGEHDIFTDDGKLYLARCGKGTQGTGWRSFTHKGVHFIGLVNVAIHRGPSSQRTLTCSRRCSRRPWQTSLTAWPRTKGSLSDVSPPSRP
jgi:hypothetical protein